MNRRTSLFITIIIAIVAIYLLVFATGYLSAPTSTSVPIQTSTPEVEPPPTPVNGSAATPIPSVPERIASATSGLENSVTTPIWAIAQMFAAILIIFFGAYGLAWLIDLIRRPSKLIMSVFENASGDTTLDSSLKGLSRLAREKLLWELKTIAPVKKKYGARVGPQEYQVSSESPQINEAVSQVLADVSKSLSEFAPDQVKPFMSIISAMFPPHGTQITTTLHRMNDSPGGIGITFEIADLQEKIAPQMQTIWESRPSKALAIPSEPVTKTLSADSSKDAKEALAAFKLAQFYAEQGMWSQAKLYCEEAFKKLRGDPEIRAALAKVIQYTKTMAERYRDLLEPAIGYLAIELTCREMLARMPMSIRYDPDQRQAYRGKVFNFVGALSQSNMYSYADYSELFFDIAIDYLKQAQDLLPDWYQPYLNLGDTYYVGAIYSQTDSADMRRHEAIAQYKQSFQMAENGIDRCLIRTCLAIARLRVSGLSDIKAIHNDIAAIERELKSQLESKEILPRLLYNLATWYAIVQEDQYKELRKNVIDLKDAQCKARRYIAYGLVRAPDRAYSAEIEPDLEMIKVDIEKIKTAISQAQLELNRKEGWPFKEAIDSILDKVLQ